jgi:thiosulfate dehydrogenase
MSHFKENWFPYLLGTIVLFVFIHGLSRVHPLAEVQRFKLTTLVPDIYELSNSAADNEIRYGKDLIDNTAKYFGPHGSIAAITNGMNCQNCHRESGTKLFTNNFLKVASTYPRYRERSGRIETVEFRINDCMQRSLNGDPIDSLGKEMKAMVAYIKWTGKNLPLFPNAKGAGNKELPFLPRAANPVRGATIFKVTCSRCHGTNGEGLQNAGGYIYPPLWGEHSYAVSAGMYRITRLASFIKSNMPDGATYANPTLTDADAWDVAAFINTQPHPIKMFPTDWPVVKTKPVDYPFGPYADNFSQQQHKYGPFGDMKKGKP